MDRTLKLTVAYDGTNYHGFQRQSNALAIQEVLEKRLPKVFGHSIKINGAARTDSGVHAYGQVITFSTTGLIPADKIPQATKTILPDDIVITRAEEVASDFHARFSAKSKIYIYRLHVSELPNPFQRNYTWHMRKKPNVLDMHQAIQVIIGEHDFSTFRAAGGAPINPVRTMLNAACFQDNEIVEVMIHGTGFLYHMVRNIVGTLVNVGWGRITVLEFEKILAGRNRALAGITAPPQGLYLKEVFY
ncbi:MAG: truA [Firmicutes bacterium]|nr:truA [Bacillota bacterium]